MPLTSNGGLGGNSLTLDLHLGRLGDDGGSDGGGSLGDDDLLGRHCGVQGCSWV